MAFLDFPFPKKYSHFLPHTKVLKYIHTYANHFSLKSNILFEHKVISVEPQHKENPLTGNYIVTWNHKGEINKKEFNYVIICNGHYSVPYIPKIEGIEHFKGKILHSHNYRDPTLFSNQNILIIGSGFSAVDISEDLKNHAAEVHVSWKKKFIRNSKDNLHFHEQTEKITEYGKVHLVNGQVIDNINVIIFCTGFQYKFDFLAESLKIQLKFKRVCDVYMNIFPINKNHPQYSTFFKQNKTTIPPSIAFVGLPISIVPFPLFDHQVQFICNIWSGKGKLPSISQMIQIMRNDCKKLDELKIPQYHVLLRGQHSYHKELASHCDKDYNSMINNQRSNFFTKRNFFLLLAALFLLASFVLYTFQNYK